MTKKIMVATVVGKMKGGGVETIVMSYMRHLDPQKFDLTLIVDEDSTQVPEQELSSLGVRLVYVPPYQRVLAYHRTLLCLLRSEQYDIVHAHINTLSVLPLFAAWRAGVPVRISHNHSTAGKGELKKNILKYMLRPFAKVFPTELCACGQYAGEWLYGKQTLFTVMPNHLDFEKETYQFSHENRKRVRNAFGLHDSVVIGHAGRFMQQKNHTFLLDIFAAFTRLEPTAILLLIGEGELLQAMQEKAKALGIEGCVRFLGQRSDVAELYQAMDVLLMPSLYEGKPLVPMEAQMSGLPVLAADTITKEIVLDHDLVEFLPLTASARQWAQALQLLWVRCGAQPRKSPDWLTGRNTAQWLEDFYMKAANQK